MTGLPEWKPDLKKTRVSLNEEYPVKFSVTTGYNDDTDTEGHNTSGIEVSQTLITYTDKKYALLKFTVFNTNKSETLDDVYIGLKSRIKPPGKSSLMRSMTNFNISEISGRPFVTNSEADKYEAIAAGVIPYSLKSVHLSWWDGRSNKLTDIERYNLLKGTPSKQVDSFSGAYTMLVSGGPFRIAPGGSDEFAVVIAIGSGESDLEMVTADAEDRLTDLRSAVFASKTAATKNFNRVPAEYILEQNFPNPFNMSTKIEFQLTESADVTLKIYDVTGREVTELFSGGMPAGKKMLVWNGRNSSGFPVSSGMYFYRLRAVNGGKALFEQTRRMVLLK
ncbi:FlgD immunoglobulin-like domain containing protein [candidate division KSB1 bacterium]